MMIALANRTLRPPVSRSVARKAAVPAKRVRRAVARATPASALDPAGVKVVADVMAALAAFGLED